MRELRVFLAHDRYFPLSLQFCTIDNIIWLSFLVYQNIQGRLNIHILLILIDRYDTYNHN